MVLWWGLNEIIDIRCFPGSTVGHWWHSNISLFQWFFHKHLIIMNIVPFAVYIEKSQCIFWNCCKIFSFIKKLTVWKIVSDYVKVTLATKIRPEKAVG